MSLYAHELADPILVFLNGSNCAECKKVLGDKRLWGLVDVKFVEEAMHLDECKQIAKDCNFNPSMFFYHDISPHHPDHRLQCHMDGMDKIVYISAYMLKKIVVCVDNGDISFQDIVDWNGIFPRKGQSPPSV
jgi:hypothetical protein